MKRGRQGEGGGGKWFDGKNEEAVLSLLRQAWSLDCPDAEASALANISPASLSRYLSTHPEVAEQKEALKLKPFLSARNTIIKGIVDGDKDTARWYLERKRKREFSTLQQVEIGEQGTYRELSDTELAQIAAGKKTPADFLGLDKKGQV